jgi:hypothetical protein
MTVHCTIHCPKGCNDKRHAEKINVPVSERYHPLHCPHMCQNHVEDNAEEEVEDGAEEEVEDGAEEEVEDGAEEEVEFFAIPDRVSYVWCNTCGEGLCGGLPGVYHSELNGYDMCKSCFIDMCNVSDAYDVIKYIYYHGACTYIGDTFVPAGHVM